MRPSLAFAHRFSATAWPSLAPIVLVGGLAAAAGAEIGCGGTNALLSGQDGSPDTATGEGPGTDGGTGNDGQTAGGGHDSAAGGGEDGTASVEGGGGDAAVDAERDAPAAGIDAGADTGGDASAAGSDGSTDGARVDAAGFSPCPAAGPCIVLPLGDSITDGFPFEAGGYRVELFHQAVSSARSITFVGSLSNGPTMVDSRPFPRNHEGHSGFTIDTAPAVGRSGISGTITDQAIANGHPHIVLLMIGTNDIDLSFQVATAPTRLGALIDEITADAPAALVVVATLIPTQTDAENVRFQAYNAAIPSLVSQRVAAGKHVMLVDMFAAFSANANFKTALMNDNLHPNAAGYALLGDTWYGAIGALLP